MGVKFSDAFSKIDWLKLTILIIVAVIAWIFVYREYKKPIIPPEWTEQLTQNLKR